MWGLALVLVVSIFSVGYLAASPALTTTAHTEFYLPTNETGPTTSSNNLELGSTNEFTVGIANHEHQEATYRIVVAVNGSELSERSVRVLNNETREVSLSVTVPTAPGQYRIEFRLYYDGGTTPDLTTWRWIRVRE